MSVYEDFQAKLKMLLELAIEQHGDQDLMSYDDIITPEMTRDAGVDALNMLTNVELIETLCAVDVK